MFEIEGSSLADWIAAIASVGALAAAVIAAVWARRLSIAANQTALDQLAMGFLTTLAADVNKAAELDSNAQYSMIVPDLYRMVKGILRARKAIDEVSGMRRSVHIQLFSALLDPAVAMELSTEFFLEREQEGLHKIMLERQYVRARAFLDLRRHSTPVNNP